MVAEDETGKVAAWISFETFYGRPAYDKTAEISIYLHQDCRGKGAGSFLLKEALALAPTIGIRSLMALSSDITCRALSCLKNSVLPNGAYSRYRRNGRKTI